MNVSKQFRLLLWIIAAIGAALSIMIIASPYGRHDGFDYKLVESHVRIEAPVDSVYAFLGNSRNAGKWSVFVDHITPLNADSVADGQPGARRRCFQQADEHGIWWDETISIAIPPVRRQLVMDTLHGFPLSVPHLATEQQYFIPQDDIAGLTFTLFFKDYEPTVLESLKMYLGAYRVKYIYDRNLRNVKRAVESRMHSVYSR